MSNQKGAIPLLILISVIGVIAAVALINLAPFKNDLLATLFPKKDSYAFAPEDWVTRGGDFNRGYYRSADLPLNNGKLNQKWKKFFGERIEVEMEPIVVGNSVFIGVMNGKLYALDKNTGATQWFFQAGGPLTDTPTAYTNIQGQLRIALPSTDGKLYVVDGGTGQKVWEYQAGEAFMSTPSFHNNTLFVGALDKKFYAIDASDTSSQRVKWSQTTSGPISNTSAIGDLGGGQMGVFVANGANTAYAFNVNGGLVWQKQLSGVYSKRTMVVYGGGKVMFVTRKPGSENSSTVENVPQILVGTKQPLDIVLDSYSDYYQTYPERRPLYFFDAATGTDLWNPLVDKRKYTPLYIPYWGEYSPLYDGANNKIYFPATTGYGAGGVLDHDMRLFQLDPTNGVIAEAGSSSEFTIRFDETGRGTLVGSKYYQTISEDVGYYDIATKQKNTAVFGNGIGNHRNPLELAELPQPIFGGMEKHFTRFGGSSSSAFGGGNDAVSPLVVSGNLAFYTTWGHLYALTSQSVTPTKDYLGLDLFTTPPAKVSDKNQVKQLLNTQIQQIVTDNKHLDPVSRFYFWGTGINSFWKDGETITALASAVPFIDEPLKTEFKAYLKNQVQNYLLNANLYQYRQSCIDYKTRLIQDPCASSLSSSWHWSNYYLVSDRLYAIYKYAEMTGDWGLVTSNWNFIKARYQQIRDAKVSNNQPAYDANSGFFLYDEWISGRFNPDLQMATMHAVEQMAIRAGDNATASEASNYLNVMKQKRPYWGKYVRGLYDIGQLVRNDFTNWQDWGYRQDIFIPKEGYLDKSNDYRQPYSVTKNTDGTIKIQYGNPRQTDPFKMTGWDFYPEFGDLLSQNLNDEISDHINMLERINPWWYMGDMGHQPISGGHEEDSTFPQIANDIFRAKAYVQKQSFDQLKNYLPWSFENYGYKDIFRIQNMVALLNAPGGVSASATPVSSAIPTASPIATPSGKPGDIDGNGKVDIFDYNVLLTNYGKTGQGLQGDLDKNGKVDIFDYNLLLTNYGK